jgi:predicted ATPase
VTLLSELIDIPERVHKSDFVISLATAIGDPDHTIGDYVVTDQLAGCFDRALSLVATSLVDRRSKSTYLHASFGAGKTAMMSVLHLLLQGDRRPGPSGSWRRS